MRERHLAKTVIEQLDGSARKVCADKAARSDCLGRRRPVQSCRPSCVLIHAERLVHIIGSEDDIRLR